MHLDKAGKMELDQGRWWLVPFFAKEIPKHAMFNARIETVDTSGAFRESFQSRRCLIPADGYFEWTVSDEDGKKDPWLLQMDGAEGFSFAGIWAHNDNLGITSCTIISAPAAPEIEHIHTRMPVIIHPASYDRWLSGEDQCDHPKALLLGSQIDSQLQFTVSAARSTIPDTKAPTPKSRSSTRYETLVGKSQSVGSRSEKGRSGPLDRRARCLWAVSCEGCSRNSCRVCPEPH